MIIKVNQLTIKFEAVLEYAHKQAMCFLGSYIPADKVMLLSIALTPELYTANKTQCHYTLQKLGFVYSAPLPMHEGNFVFHREYHNLVLSHELVIPQFASDLKRVGEALASIIKVGNNN